MLGEDADTAEVTGVQTALVGQGTDNGTRADALTVSDADPVDGQFLAVAVGDLRGVPVEALGEGTVHARVLLAAVPVVAGATLTTLRLLDLLDVEGLATLEFRGQSGGDVRRGDIIGLGVLGDECAEDIDLLALAGFGDRGEELVLPGLVDLVDTRQLDLIGVGLGRTLDVLQQTTLTRGDEEDRPTGAAGAAGTADTVHVGLGVPRDVVVEDVGDAVDVEATGGDVGRHQDVQSAVLELVDGAFTLVLRDVTVDGRSLEATGPQLVGELLGVALGPHEDDHRVELGDLEDAGQRVELVAVRHHQVVLRDVVTGPLLGLDGVFLGVVEVLLRQTTDRRGHGRGEERDLAGVRSVGEDALDILLEAHVEHLVGLVEDEEAQVGQIQAALLQVVDDTARCTHDDLCATAQAGQLCTVGGTAVDREDAHATDVAGEGLEGVSRLERELTGRGQDEHLRVALGGVQAGQGRQREGRGLAGTGLGEADDVVPVHQSRDGGRLDRGRRDIADLLHCGENTVGQAEARETGLSLSIVVVFCRIFFGDIPVRGVLGIICAHNVTDAQGGFPGGLEQIVLSNRRLGGVRLVLVAGNVLSFSHYPHHRCPRHQKRFGRVYPRLSP